MGKSHAKRNARLPAIRQKLAHRWEIAKVVILQKGPAKKAHWRRNLRRQCLICAIST
jgi:hypothetical protein